MQGLAQNGVKMKSTVMATGYGQPLLDQPVSRPLGPEVIFTQQWAPVELKTKATKQFQADLKKYADYTGVPDFGIYTGYTDCDLAITGLRSRARTSTRARTPTACASSARSTRPGSLPAHRHQRRDLRQAGPDRSAAGRDVKDGKFVLLSPKGGSDPVLDREADRAQSVSHPRPPPPRPRRNRTAAPDPGFSRRYRLREGLDRRRTGSDKEATRRWRGTSRPNRSSRRSSIGSRQFVGDEIEPLDLLFPHRAFTSTRRRRAADRAAAEAAGARRQGCGRRHLGPELGGKGYGQVKLAFINEILGTFELGADRLRYARRPTPATPRSSPTTAPRSRRRSTSSRCSTASCFSCYSMTEPQAGADPTLFTTRAEKDGDEWVINGWKFFSSNAQHRVVPHRDGRHRTPM